MIEAYGIPYRISTPLVGRLAFYEDPELASFPTIKYTRKELGSDNNDKSIGYVSDTNMDLLIRAGQTSHFSCLHSVNLESFNHGDGVVILPEGKIICVYRHKSDSNVLFVTSRCNSHCITCPQPPEKHEEHDWSRLAIEILRILDPDIETIGITGGEPTLLGEDLFHLVESIKKRLPLATLHILTNGRYFAQSNKAHDLASINHPKMLLGIPLFSDNPYDHDSITGASGSFGETVKGIINLGHFDIAVEIRLVMIKQVVSRLNNIVEFIYRNIPFASQVCFMGLEPIGLANKNYDTIWCDPVDYQEILKSAIEYLSLRGIHANIYNEQLCVLNKSLWKYNIKAISDWKNVYIESCTHCKLRGECGGFFSSSASGHHSKGIHKIVDG